MKKLLACLALLTLTSAHALVLEKIQEKGDLQKLLSHKKIGFFIGSFDPLHVGLEEVIQESIKQGYCDYVIVFPLWENSKNKQMEDVNVRLDMLFAVFEDDPKVIVTRLAPQEIQSLLSKADPKNPQQRDESIKDADYIGIVGSDTALDFLTNKEVGKIFMTGETIGSKFYNSIAGTLAAIPTEDFVVAIQGNHKLDALKGKLLGKPIIGTFQNKHSTLTSLELRNTIKKGESVEGLINPQVIEIISDKKLYR